MVGKNLIVAANWKMNKTPEEGEIFVEKLKNKFLNKEKVDIILCVSYPLLFHMNSLLDSTGIQLGAQNMHWEQMGPFTGEVSPRMLKACGVRYVILGHSERRHLFGETNKMIEKKVISALESRLIPILCVGETADERNQGKTQIVLHQQLTPIIKSLNEKDRGNIIFAYEPIWAIGTGITATLTQIKNAHHDIREIIQNRLSTNNEKERILYGGSVSPNNAKELIEVEGVDGFLIGGASLESESFSQIIKIVEEHKR